MATLDRTSLKLAHNGLTVIHGAGLRFRPTHEITFHPVPSWRVYYCEDTTTRKQSRPRTKNEAEAITLLNGKNKSFRQPRFNVQIARAYLTARAPAVSCRTWQAVMDELQTHDIRVSHF